MGALFERVKIWIAESLAFADLNAEIQNILDKFTPVWMDDYSATVAQMKLTTDPGSTGSESQPTSLSEELERLRFVIKRIIGADATNWYDAGLLDLTDANDLISAGNKIPANRIVSGRVRSATDGFPIYLTPKNSTNEATVEGASTNLVYRIAGVAYTLAADVDITGQSQAPSTNNTALVNDTALADGAQTRTVGENGRILTIDTVGSEISSLVGEYHAFKIAPGVDEYFYALVKSSTELSDIRRGYFFNSSDAPIARQPIANNDTITLMRAAYIFITTTGTLSSTLNLPKVQFDEPSSPSNGDYWFDIANSIWKIHNGSAFVDSLATYVGITVTDSSNTVAARSETIFALYDDLNTVIPFTKSTSTVEALHRSAAVSVGGNIYNFPHKKLLWDMASNVDDGDIYTSGEQASTRYFFYLNKSGDVHISDVEPYDQRESLKGFYHPYHIWRFLGRATNDGSSNLGNASFHQLQEDGENPGYDGIVVSASSGAFTTTSATYTAVTNLSCKISTKGRPVHVAIISDGSTYSSTINDISSIGGTATTNSFAIKIDRSGTSVAEHVYREGLAATPSMMPGSAVQHVDRVAAGEYTYTVQVRNQSGANTIAMRNLKLIAYEI